MQKVIKSYDDITNIYFELENGETKTYSKNYAFSYWSGAESDTELQEYLKQVASIDMICIDCGKEYGKAKFPKFIDKRCIRCQVQYEFDLTIFHDLELIDKANREKNNAG